MPVREIGPHDRRERRRFIALERALLEGASLFVGEIESDLDRR